MKWFDFLILGMVSATGAYALPLDAEKEASTESEVKRPLTFIPKGQDKNKIRCRIGITPNTAWFLGDLNPHGLIGLRYRPKDASVREWGNTIVPEIGIGKQWKCNYWSASLSMNRFRIRVSDKGSIHDTNGDRLLTSDIKIQSFDASALVGINIGCSFYAEGALGAGLGRANPTITGAPEVLQEFTDRGFLDPKPVNYSFIAVSTSLKYGILRWHYRHASLEPILFGVKLNWVWRASDGLDGYQYIALNDRLGKRGGKDSYFQLGLSTVVHVNSGYWGWRKNARNGRKYKEKAKAKKVRRCR